MDENQPAKDNRPKDDSRPKNRLKNWAVFTGMALQMGIVIVMGVLFGVWLDGKIPNNYSAFTIIFSLLGVFAALYTVIRQVKNLNHED